MRPLTLYSALAEVAKENPSGQAFSYEGKGLSLSAFMSQADRVAGYLASVGVGKGDVVSVCLPNIPQALIAFYGINRLGAVVNMIHPLTPEKQLQKMLDETGSKALFLFDMLPVGNLRGKNIILCSAADYLPPVKAFAYRVGHRTALKGIRWKEALRANRESAEAETDLADCAVLLHSGGTTGEPKSIMLSARAFNALADMGPHMAGLTELKGKKMLTVLPLFHGFGLGVCVHTVLLNGATPVLMPKFSPDKMAGILRRERPNMMAAVPTMLEALLKSKVLEGQDLSFLESVFCGGDTLTEDLKQRFDGLLERGGAKCCVMQGYGLTETVTVCCVNTSHACRAHSVGRVNPNMRVKVIAPDTREEAAAGQEGELCFAGETLMKGYLNDPAATERTIFTDKEGVRWVRTGDYGRVDEEGFVYFKQRLKRIIKSSGVAVFPSEIEACVESVKGVSLCCAIGVPHPVKGETVKVFAVSDGTVQEDILHEQIMDRCREQLIVWAVPREIEFRDSLPMTPVGKVDYQQLS